MRGSLSIFSYNSFVNLHFLIALTKKGDRPWRASRFMTAFLEMHLTSEVSLVFFPSGFTASWAIRMCELRSHFRGFVRAKKSVVRNRFASHTSSVFQRYTTALCFKNRQRDEGVDEKCA